MTIQRSDNDALKVQLLRLLIFALPHYPRFVWCRERFWLNKKILVMENSWVSLEILIFCSWASFCHDPYDFEVIQHLTIPKTNLRQKKWVAVDQYSSLLPYCSTGSRGGVFTVLFFSLLLLSTFWLDVKNDDLQLIHYRGVFLSFDGVREA